MYNEIFIDNPLGQKNYFFVQNVFFLTSVRRNKRHKSAIQINLITV